MEAELLRSSAVEVAPTYEQPCAPVIELTGTSADQSLDPDLDLIVPPTFQSHVGLGTFTLGDKVAYSKGERFTAKSALFPIQEELAQWTSAVTIQTALGDPARDKRQSLEDGRLVSKTQEILNKAHAAVRASTATWQQCVRVDEEGLARVRRHPNRKSRAAPSYVVPASLAKGVLPIQRPFPLAAQIPATTYPKIPTPPPAWLKEKVARDLQSWEDCIHVEARRRLHAAMEAAAKDEAVISEGPATAHRQRARCGTRAAEVRIGPDELHSTVNEVLKLGLTLDLSSGTPKIRELRQLPLRDWGINACALLRDAEAIDWPDKELLCFLKYGFMDFSGKSPPISSYSPHQQKAVRDLAVFREQVAGEVARGWMGPPLKHPPSIPFQVRPGSLEPKSEGRHRLVWNASWPAPGSLDSAVMLGDSWYPVAPNASTVLPPSVEFEWGAIEANNEVIDIMADGARYSGSHLLGRTFDLSKWFRQLGVATLDRWKCTVHAAGGFREDRRLQMGRRSSAHSGQRTTFLATELLQRVAQKERWGLRNERGGETMAEKKEQAALADWLERRNRATSYKGAAQSCLVHFSSFQDDITAVALGRRAAQDATEGVLRVLQGTYGIPLSDKKEANREFNGVFTAIGASYDLTDPHRVQCSPRPQKIAKYAEMIEGLRKAGPLIPLHEMQTFAGLHTFMSRFLDGGEFYCNSAYCCLRADPHTSAALRPVSARLLQDAETVLSMLRDKRLATLTADPRLEHPGEQGFSADASGATSSTAAGWGVHVQGVIASGKWSRGIKKALADNKLSISPLELLAAAMALDVAARHPHKLPSGSTLVLRSDSESTCAVVNSMRADSAPMLEALRILKEVQDATGLRLWLQYIPTAANSIADSLSRGAEARAKREAGRINEIVMARHPVQTELWYCRLLTAALQAARHRAEPSH